MILALEGGERPAEHALHEVEFADLRHRMHRDGAPVPHDRDAVADLVEFVETMGDKEDADAVRPQRAHGGEQGGDFALVERRGRLVHDHELGLSRDRARDRHHLPRRGIEGAQRLADVDDNVEAGERGGGIVMNAAPVDQPVAARFGTEIDVLGDAPEGNKIDFLINCRDSGGLRGGGGAEIDPLAVEDNLTAVAPVGAGKDLDHCRFAGAILADQRHDFAGLYLKRSAGKCRHT